MPSIRALPHSPHGYRCKRHSLTREETRAPPMRPDRQPQMALRMGGVLCFEVQSLVGPTLHNGGHHLNFSFFLDTPQAGGHYSLKNCSRFN